MKDDRFKILEEYARHLEQEIRNRDQELQEARTQVARLQAYSPWYVDIFFRWPQHIWLLLRPRIRRRLISLPGGVEFLQKIRSWRHDYLQIPTSKYLHPTDLSVAKQVLRKSMSDIFEEFMANGDQLSLPNAEKPKLSVILVLWNQAELTFSCLDTLAREFDVPLEIIIVDNASSDHTESLLERLTGAQIIRNEINIGFLRAVNQGVAAAHGEYILLLNNDAMLRPTSLAAAVETMQSEPNIGAVGGRIVLPDGRLQEAGSIIWQDGSCLGYARNEHAESSEAMFRRDVDYCSGAFLLFRRDTFQRLGGFDEAFAPAYYEETDFCLRLWENGLRVVFDPRIVIDHFEFGSSEKSEDALALQARNREIFLSKHVETLRRHLPASPSEVLRARTHQQGQRRLLFIDDRVPLESLGAGFPRARRMVHDAVSSGYFVTLYPLQFPHEEWSTTYACLPPTVEVAMGLGMSGLEAFLTKRRNYYDVLLVSRPHNMMAVVKLRRQRPNLFAGLRVIYDAEALFSLRTAMQARLFDDKAALAQAENELKGELALTNAADEVIAVSEHEAEQFRAHAGRKVHIIGHALHPKPTSQPFREREGLLFVGALDDERSPNVDSLEWFVGEVLPCLQAQLGGPVDLNVVGRNKAPSVQRLRSGTVRLVGRVERLEAWYDRARVFIAPTRFAGGIPHKVHEAAAFGLPVVATSLLARQLGWQDGVEILVADSPEDFAHQVARLHTDPALWTAIRTAALERVARDCDPSTFRHKVRAVLDAGSDSRPTKA